jgi:hypothetical protein
MLTLIAVIIGLCVLLYVIWRWIQGMNQLK